MYIIGIKIITDSRIRLKISEIVSGVCYLLIVGYKIDSPSWKFVQVIYGSGDLKTSRTVRRLLLINPRAEYITMMLS